MKKATVCSVFLLVLHLLNCFCCFSGSGHHVYGSSDNLLDKIHAEITFDIHQDQYYTLTPSIPTLSTKQESPISGDWICHSIGSDLSENIFYLQYLKNAMVLGGFSAVILFQLYPFHFFF